MKRNFNFFQRDNKLNSAVVYLKPKTVKPLALGEKNTHTFGPKFSTCTETRQTIILKSIEDIVQIPLKDFTWGWYNNILCLRDVGPSGSRVKGWHKS